MNSFPEWLVPMAATLTQERFSGPEWIFERKFDGIRLLAYKNGDDVQVFSRNHLPKNLPAVRGAVRFRGAFPQIPEGALQDAGRAARAEEARAARAVRRVKWLTGRGWAAAAAVGAATIWGFGWRGVTLLLAFFISASALSRKKTTRNARQVIANGGVAALAALSGSWTWFAGALATANAD